MTYEKELVSIIIPTYSRNDTLKRAIDSALNQTYENFEIIVVDDNIADSEWRKSTELLMAQYEAEPRIRYIKNIRNLGGAGARNEGIKIAKGDYIAFLDDDDEYLPDNILDKMKCFQKTNNPKLALVYGYCEYVDKGKVVYEEKRYFNGCCLFEAMRENCIAATSQWLTKKRALLEIGMFTVVPSKQDSQLILKLVKNGFELACVPKILSRYYLDMDQFLHISNDGRKPLEGELLYRDECRKQYKHLTQKQISEVEYSFAQALFDKYTNVDDVENAKAEKKKMFSLNVKKAAIFFTKRELRKVKRYLKSILK